MERILCSPQMLEPCEWKLSRTVLRGGGGGNASSLPDYANMAIATAFAYGCFRVHAGSVMPMSWVDLGLPLLVTFLLIASRDALCRFYARTGQLLAPRRRSAR